MGSSASKSRATTASSSSSSSEARRTRSKGSRVFQYSCLGSSDSHQVSDNHNEGCGGHGPCSNKTDTECGQVNTEDYRKGKPEQCDESPCLASRGWLDEWGQESLNDAVSRAGRSSCHSHSTRSNPSGRFISRFGISSGSVSFRLGRTTSLGSSGSHPLSSSSFTDSNNEEEFHLRTGPIGGLVNRNEARQGSSLLSAHLISSSTAAHLEGTAHNRLLTSPASGYYRVLGDDVAIPTGGIDYTANSYDINTHSRRSHTEMESNETRLAERRVIAREPVERNFRFSRTLSVGRLRDRVLRRTSISAISSCTLQQEREVRGAHHGGRRQAWGGGEGTGSASNDIALIAPNSPSYAPSNTDGFVYNSEGSEVGTPQSRAARYHDLLEHRLTFLERRRRIRTQVHALQRLGSRFENMSRHERSCVLFGQHQTAVMGRCSCRRSTQNSTLNDDTSARASISRIVMLAEALFEVLDEIHQQSVVLSSRTSVSSIGSVPAPTEIVESLPVKLYTKVQKSLNEDVAQCYICLVEYEEGDDMRILPCCHEFHRVCIDKWLKEIHRVCPLCRGDVCRFDSLQTEN